MSYKIYGPASFKNSFKAKIRNRQVKSGLSVEIVEDGVIALNRKSGAYGVFDAYKNFVDLSIQTRTKHGQPIPKLNNTQDIPFIDETVIYFGNIIPYFGHFLLENINRAYALPDGEKVKVVFVDDKCSPIYDFVYQFMVLLDVSREDVIILDKTTRFKKVIVPEQAFNMSFYSSKEFAMVGDKMASSVPSNQPVYEKIYFSREKMGDRKTLGEEKIQKIFENNGYKVIYPETMQMGQVVSLMKDCKSLAGCAGSALHWSIFMPAGSQVIQIKRNRKTKCNAPLQYLINSAKDIESVFISGSIESTLTRHNTEAPQIIGVTKYMRAFFNDFGFKYSPSDFCADTDAWKEYKKRMKNYKHENGSVIWNELKRIIVKLSICMIPGRERKKRIRMKLKERLKVD